MLSLPVRTGLRALSKSSNASSRCCYFSTTPRQSIQALVKETGSSELNEILKHIQDKIILPTYLPNKQRQIIHDITKRPYLRENPIVMEFEGHKHTFESIDKRRDLKPTHPMLSRILNLMDSPTDWDNLAIVLAGYKRAGIKLQAETRGVITRKAMKAGHIDALLDCATHANETGMYITNKEILTQILSGINGSAAKGSIKDAKRALTQTEQVLELVQRKDHTDRWVSAFKGDKPHFSVVARMLALFTRARYVKKCQNAGGDVSQDMLLLSDEAALVSTLCVAQKTKEVEKFRDFMEINPNHDRERTEWLKDARKEAKQNKTPGPGDRGLRGLSASGYITAMAQSMQGLKLTHELLGEKAASLGKLAGKIDNHITKFAKVTNAPEARKVGWTKAYKTVVRTHPTWAVVPEAAAEVEKKNVPNEQVESKIE